MRTTSSTSSNVASGDAPEHIFFDSQLRDSKQRVVEPPAFASGTHIADTHAHLDMLHYPGLALARAAANKVSFIVSVIDPTEGPSYTFDNLEGWLSEAEELLGQWSDTNQLPHDDVDLPHDASTIAPPEVRIIMGCHPHNASRYDEVIENEIIRALTSEERVVGIGEIGLDYHYDNSPRPVQREVFRRQIQLAHRYNTTVALHLREAHDEGLSILKEEGLPEKGVLLHCYNLDYATLEPFLELGLMVAYGGPLTFKKSDEVREAAALTPLNRLVTETDAPFMAPVPIRGTICEPASVVFTAELLAGLHAESTTASDALALFYDNAQRFFSKENS